MMQQLRIRFLPNVVVLKIMQHRIQITAAPNQNQQQKSTANHSASFPDVILIPSLDTG